MSLCSDLPHPLTHYPEWVTSPQAHWDCKKGTSLPVHKKGTYVCLTITVARIPSAVVPKEALELWNQKGACHRGHFCPYCPNPHRHSPALGLNCSGQQFSNGGLGTPECPETLFRESIIVKTIFVVRCCLCVHSHFLISVQEGFPDTTWCMTLQETEWEQK